jgi:hypothetical protein
MLCRLRPQPPAPGREGGLLGAVNAFLSKTRPGRVPCLITPGLAGADLLPIALPAPLRLSPFFFPQRFVAVNPNGATFLHLSALYNHNQPLAVFKFLQRLCSDRLLDAAADSALQKKAARRLLRACHE